MTNPIPGADSEHDDTPVSMSTYGSKEACEAEHARRAAAKVGANVAALEICEQVVAELAKSPRRQESSYIEGMIVGANMCAERIRLAAGAPTETPKPVIGAGDPDAFFVQFCEAKGYPSDSEMDESLRAAYYEGIKYCCTLAAQPAPIAGDVEKDAAMKKLGGAVKMVVNMLTRDNTPVRIEAAGVLLAAFGEAAQPAAMLANSSSGEAG